jgi:hypothetical protein
VVIPLLLYLFLYGVAFLREGVGSDTALIFGAMVLVIVGLGLFLEGLTLGVMPLGEVIGKTLPAKCPLGVTLGIAFFLGVAVTFAEPAIGALQQAGDSIDTFKSPYLYYILNEWELYVVLMVGAGVGVAAVVGTLRFMYGVSIKPIIYVAVSFTILLTIIATYANTATAQLIGLAWDCGAVTTGPVTVPILLALGLGITAATKGDDADEGSYSALLANSADSAPKQSLAGSGRHSGYDDLVLKEGTQPDDLALEEEGGALEAFGIVTLASLFPIIGVYTLGLVLTQVKSVDEILTEVHGDCYGAEEDRCEQCDTCEWNQEDLRCEVVQDSADLAWSEQTPMAEIINSVTALAPLIVFMMILLRVLGEPLPVLCVRAHDNVHEMQVWTGLAFALLGLMIFNVGLTKGLSQLGNNIGGAVPGAFDDTSDSTEDDNGTPYFDRGVGIFITLVFVWFLGFGSTLAEPALATLGLTVETLSNGKFTKSVILYSVAVGVSTGLMLGTLKIVVSLPLIFFILPLYPLALLISSQSEEDLVCIAWDSAGVTTGPVTVPLVLALGNGIGGVVTASEEGGFGILTLSSIGPILSVLISGCYRQWVMAHRRSPTL